MRVLGRGGHQKELQVQPRREIPIPADFGSMATFCSNNNNKSYFCIISTCPRDAGPERKIEPSPLADWAELVTKPFDHRAKQPCCAP